jgi:hypothetical protein
MGEVYTTRMVRAASSMIDETVHDPNMKHLDPESGALCGRAAVETTRVDRARRHGLRRALCSLVLGLALVGMPGPGQRAAQAIGDKTSVEIRTILYAGGNPTPRPNAARRLAWEVRQRTSVETRLESSQIRLTDPHVYDTPLLYFSGDRAFPPLSEAEVQGLRRFVDYGGFVIIDDASNTDDGGFDSSVRRTLTRAFGAQALARVDDKHVVYRSFYLVSRPVGRVEGPAYLEGIERAGRLAVVYSRHDLGGAYERDNLGNYAHAVVPGSERQRELAFRLGVNLILYALCLDYKDDQVHAPFIMRRWAGRP